MPPIETPDTLRHFLLAQLMRAEQALADDDLGDVDALAIVRNVAAGVLQHVELASGSPAFAQR